MKRTDVTGKANAAVALIMEGRVISGKYEYK